MQKRMSRFSGQAEFSHPPENRDDVMQASEFYRRFPGTAAMVEEGIARGLHHGAQIYISQRGTVLADVGLGLAIPDVPLTSNTTLPWLSAGKPLTALLIGQLVDAGHLVWDDPVVKFLPGFGSHGKRAITLRHLLTHTAGLCAIDTGWPTFDWQESLRRICEATLPAGWIPGESAGYDPGASWFVLGEIVRQITGQDFSVALTERILTPLGLQHTTVNLVPDSAMPVGWMWEREQGQLVPTDWHQPPRGTHPSPGSSVRGPIRELGRLYEAILAWGWNVEAHDIAQRLLPPVLSREIIRVMTSRERQGKFDQTLGHIVDFGLGFLLDSKFAGADTVPYGYGRNCSPRSFGHGGSQSSQGYCDPERGLVIAYVFNGRPGEGQHQRRNRTFHAAVESDLARLAEARS